MFQLNVLYPRPGSHEHNVERDRKVQFEESFGGQRRLRKTIVTKCTLGIPDKVRSIICWE